MQDALTQAARSGLLILPSRSVTAPVLRGAVLEYPAGVDCPHAAARTRELVRQYAERQPTQSHRQPR